MGERPSVKYRQLKTHTVVSIPCPWPPLALGGGWLSQWPGTALHGLAAPVLTGLCPGLLRVHICLQSCVSRTLLAITCPATVINIY